MARDTEIESSRNYLKPAAVLVLAFLVRLTFLNYNGPFVDESFYSIALKYGNVHYLIGEVYLWPAVAYFAYEINGAGGMRLVAALLGTLSVWVVYGITLSFIQQQMSAQNEHRVGLFATLIFALSAPPLYVSCLGTYDAMADMFLLLGLWQLLRGMDKHRSMTLIGASMSIAIAFMTRYHCIIYLPLLFFYVIYEVLSKRMSYRLGFVFLATLTAIVGGYILLRYEHVLSSIIYAREQATRLSEGRPAYEIIGAVLSIAPVEALFAAIGAGICAFQIRQIRAIRKAAALIFLIFGALTASVYHVSENHQRGLVKNLCISMAFAAPFIGVGLNRLWDLVGRWTKRNHVSTLILIILLSGLYIHSRSVFERFQMWPDWTNVAPVIQSLGLAEKEIWCTRGHNVWQLRREIGENVNVDSPWLAPDPILVLQLAAEKRIPVVVGPLWWHDLKIGAEIHGYHVAAVVKVPRGRPVYIFKRVR